MPRETLRVKITAIGFFTLAAILLVPVYRFLSREESASRQWTRERAREQPPDPQKSANNGSGNLPETGEDLR
jgi:hypothetical protein